MQLKNMVGLLTLLVSAAFKDTFIRLHADKIKINRDTPLLFGGAIK